MNSDVNLQLASRAMVLHASAVYVLSKEKIVKPGSGQASCFWHGMFGRSAWRRHTTMTYKNDHLWNTSPCWGTHGSC